MPLQVYLAILANFVVSLFITCPALGNSQENPQHLSPDSQIDDPSQTENGEKQPASNQKPHAKHILFAGVAINNNGSIGYGWRYRPNWAMGVNWERSDLRGRTSSYEPIQIVSNIEGERQILAFFSEHQGENWFVRLSLNMSHSRFRYQLLDVDSRSRMTNRPEFVHYGFGINPGYRWHIQLADHHVFVFGLDLLSFRWDRLWQSKQGLSIQGPLTSELAAREQIFYRTIDKRKDQQHWSLLGLHLAYYF